MATRPPSASSSPLPLPAPEVSPAIAPASLGPVAVQRRVPPWRFWIPLLLQVTFVLLVPARSAYTYFTGQTVVLQTVPVDPYNLLTGYSQTLNYTISNLSDLKEVEGWGAVNALDDPSRYNDDDQTKAVYVTLEAPAGDRPREPWQPVAIATAAPEDLAPNQVVIRGHRYGGQIRYGLETYYMPEDQREDLNRRISEVQRRPMPVPGTNGTNDANNGQGDRRQAFVVEARVGSDGTAVPERLWIDGQAYRF
ncbi:MAG: GDYXXLXY domain-containing protein [Cyanobacteria bacterium]|nr:GDYXXLXY domain-containing protein [Cyanobacteriota bacterium]